MLSYLLYVFPVDKVGRRGLSTTRRLLSDLLGNLSSGLLGGKVTLLLFSIVMPFQIKLLPVSSYNSQQKAAQTGEGGARQNFQRCKFLVRCYIQFPSKILAHTQM